MENYTPKVVWELYCVGCRHVGMECLYLTVGFKNFLYPKDNEHLYHAFMYSPVSLLSCIYPLPAMHSLLVASDVRNIN